MEFIGVNIQKTIFQNHNLKCNSDLGYSSQKSKKVKEVKKIGKPKRVLDLMNPSKKHKKLLIKHKLTSNKIQLPLQNFVALVHDRKPQLQVTKILLLDFNQIGQLLHRIEHPFRGFDDAIDPSRRHCIERDGH